MMVEKTENEKMKKRIELFERYHNDPDQYHKIFTELGFSYMADDCDGICKDCKENGDCEVFTKLKNDK
jgi:hypothetical protein